MVGDREGEVESDLGSAFLGERESGRKGKKEGVSKGRKSLARLNFQGLKNQKVEDLLGSSGRVSSVEESEIDKFEVVFSNCRQLR